MQLPSAVVSYNHWVVSLSYLIAAFASYVALDLAKRVRGDDVTVARAWWWGGSAAMGTGIWSTHFVGMLAVSLPFAVGYSWGLTILSWLAAVAASAIPLHTANRTRLSPAKLASGSLAMGARLGARVMARGFESQVNELRIAHQGSDIESIYRIGPSSDGGRGMVTAGVWGSSF